MSTKLQELIPESVTISSNLQQISNADSTVIGITNSKIVGSSPGSKNEHSSTIMESEANALGSSKFLEPEDEFGMPPAIDINYHLKNGDENSQNYSDTSLEPLPSHAIEPEEQINSDDILKRKTADSQSGTENVLQVLTLPVMTDEQSKTVTIGRSSKSNDFQLAPKSALISRTHLAVTYFPNTNSLRIKCYGKNGVVVNFPRVLKYKLVRQLKEKIFELVPRDSDVEAEAEILTKHIVSQKGITSFVLNEKEICFIPYMTGLQLSFGSVSLELVIKHCIGEEIKKSEKNRQEKNVNIPSSPLAEVVEYDENDRSEDSNENLQSKLLSEEHSDRQQQSKNIKRQNDDSKGNSLSYKKQKLSSKSDSTASKRQALDSVLEKLKVLDISIKELVHLLTNHIAFAPVQQIPLKQLYESNNTTTKHLTLPQFKIFTENLLLHLEPSIQMIPRKGKDAAGKLLDPEFFYDVEKDTNEERILIVGSLKGGRSGLRSCRKTHKQYFWKKPTK